MDVANRVLGALELSAMTADELSKALSVQIHTMRRVLAQLLKGRYVTATACAQGRQVGAPPRLYRLTGAKQVPLGRVSAPGALAMAKRINELLLEHGEVAVFVDASRMVSVALHHEAGYDDALNSLGDILVGRYVRTEDEPFKSSLIADDILDRLDELARRRAKVRA